MGRRPVLRKRSLDDLARKIAPRHSTNQACLDHCNAQSASEIGESETPNHVRSEGSFPRKRSPGAGDGCTASHCQPGSRLVAELDRIADAGAGDPGICNGPTTDSCSAAKP